MAFSSVNTHTFENKGLIKTHMHQYTNILFPHIHAQTITQTC